MCITRPLLFVLAKNARSFMKVYIRKKGFKMELTLLDYAGKKKTFDIGNLEDIVRIRIRIISGDEIAFVVYKNDEIKRFASNWAIYDFYDGEYDVYSVTSGRNLLDNPVWINRETSYSWFDRDEE